MTAQHKILALIISAALLILGWWFLNHFELQKYEMPLPATGEAKYNKLFAAEQYLRASKTTVDSITLPDLITSLPDTDAVILMDNNRFSGKKNLNTLLLNWVQSGGHLILRPGYRPSSNEENAIDDKLLNSLGISVKPIQTEISELPIEITFPQSGNQQTLFIESYSYTYLSGELPTDWIVKDNHGIHLIQRRLGKGLITVWSDLAFLGNDHIGEQNHALVLWHLVHLPKTPSKVWLVFSEQSESLIAILWRNFKPVLAIFSCIAILWLIGAMQRFGPLKPQPTRASRSILEHINASAMYYWRSGQSGKLIQKSRDALHQKMIMLHPAWRSLSNHEKESHLAQTTQWRSEDIKAILHTQKAGSKEEFTRLIQQIELLRKSL